MAQWYLDTENQLLIDTFQRTPFDALAFDADGNSTLFSRFECIGVGQGLRMFGEFLAYCEIPNMLPPVEVVREQECVILVTREKAAQSFINEWFRVDPNKFCPYPNQNRIQSIAASEAVAVPYQTGSGGGLTINTVSGMVSVDTGRDKSVHAVFQTIRDICTHSVMCFMDGSTGLGSPVILDVCANDESDAVALGMLDREAVSTASSISFSVGGSNVWVGGSSISAGTIWNSAITTDHLVQADIRDADFTVGGKKVRIREEANGEISVKIGERHFAEREERSSDCLYPYAVY